MNREHDGEEREKRLLRITCAICDGIPVDWKAEGERSPDLRGLFGRLALVQRIRTAARKEGPDS